MTTKSQTVNDAVFLILFSMVAVPTFFSVGAVLGWCALSLIH